MIHLKVVEQFYAQPVDMAAARSKQQKVQEDRVDELLRQKDGKIQRGRDPHYCRHGAQGMCTYCLPLEPYDTNYQKEHKIKHLSFHAYLRKLSDSAAHDIGPVLEEADYAVKRDCTRHPPYPEGICTACQPSAIVLNQQSFRMVDHVEFESHGVVEAFLAGWRSNGFQRFGWLFGRYEPYDGVPLGIKAVVSVIYEPPQDGSVDGFQLLEDANGESTSAAEIASAFALQPVGMIYTDLTDDGSGTGKVQCKRSAETHFVSSLEALFMAQQQLAHPSPCTDSRSGRFSSKFVTVVLSGDSSGEIDLLPFQVSNAAEAMVRAELVEATTDPGLVIVRPSEPAHYVPDVIYKHTDEYGNVVQRKAEPFFPVEYLLLTLSHGFPVNSDPVFKATAAFPNSAAKPSLTILKRYMDSASNEPATVALSNFNLLLFLKHTNAFTSDEFTTLCTAIARRDHAKLEEIKSTWSSWRSLMEQARAGGAANQRPSDQQMTDWQCPHCTFLNLNRPTDSCEICGLPNH